MTSHLTWSKSKIVIVACRIWPPGLLSDFGSYYSPPYSLPSCHTCLFAVLQTHPTCVCSGPFTCCSLHLGHSSDSHVPSSLISFSSLLNIIFSSCLLLWLPCVNAQPLPNTLPCLSCFIFFVYLLPSKM